MGVINLPDEVQRVVDQQVAEGRAASASAFVEEAVVRLIHDARAEEDEIAAAARAGVADIEAGRFVIVATAEDTQLLHDRLMARLREELATGQ